ncbi:hypothetical protein L914_03623, partial [Phytophthora nicotianae]
VFVSVSGRHMAIKFIMANAEAAQQNAVEQGFSVDCEVVYVMCFNHVLANLIAYASM